MARCERSGIQAPGQLSRIQASSTNQSSCLGPMTAVAPAGGLGHPGVGIADLSSSVLGKASQISLAQELTSALDELFVVVSADLAPQG